MAKGPKDMDSNDPLTDTRDTLLSGDDLDDALLEVFPPRPDRLFLRQDEDKLAAVIPPGDIEKLAYETLVSTAELTKYFGVTPQWVLTHLMQGMFPTPVRLGDQAFFRLDEISEIFSFIDLNPNDTAGIRLLVRTLLETRPVIPGSLGEYKVRSGEIKEASARAGNMNNSLSLFGGGLN